MFFIVCWSIGIYIKLFENVMVQPLYVYAKKLLYVYDNQFMYAQSTCFLSIFGTLFIVASI